MVAAGLLFSSVASAAPIPWSNSNGTAVDSMGNPVLMWSGGANDNDLFGSPQVIVTGTGANARVDFLFFPSNFRASSNNGVAASVSDRLQVQLMTASGLAFSGFGVTENGDYSILGTGSVSATGAMFITNLAPPPPVGTTYSSSLVTTPAFPVTSGAGLWSGTSGAFTPALPSGLNKVQLVLNNVLQATSGPTSSAFIEKKTQGVIITLFLPEPATASVVMLGSAVLLGRRRMA